jgi:hypothetical protein
MLHRMTLYVSKLAIFVGRARSPPLRRRMSESRLNPKDLQPQKLAPTVHAGCGSCGSSKETR